MMNDALISVVLSFRNEEEVLDELLQRLRSACTSVTDKYELIFINDASTDNSRDVLERMAGQDARIKIINMSRTFGVSQCALAGMEYASGKAVITMDADLQ